MCKDKILIDWKNRLSRGTNTNLKVIRASIKKISIIIKLNNIPFSFGYLTTKLQNLTFNLVIVIYMYKCHFYLW